MLVVSEREQLVLYQTSADTDHGRLEVWVDGLLNWKAGVRAYETPDGVEQLDERARCWCDGIREIVNMRQRTEAFEILDGYLSDLLRGVNEVFSDTSDPMCEAWEQAAILLRHIFPGFVEYYIEEADLFLDLNEAMPAFTQPQVVSLGGGLREFQLTTSEVDGEYIVWAEKRDPASGVPGTRDHKVNPLDRISLVDVVDYATGSETREVLELHLFAMVQAAEHLRFVINKLRAGVAITRSEMIRLRSFSGTILEFQEQFRRAT